MRQRLQSSGCPKMKCSGERFLRFKRVKRQLIESEATAGTDIPKSFDDTCIPSHHHAAVADHEQKQRKASRP